MSLPEVLLSEAKEAFGEQRATEIGLVDGHVRDLFRVSKNCQFLGKYGILDTYADLIREVEMLKIPKKPMTPEQVNVVERLWDIVDREMVNILAKNCNCRTA